MPVMVFELYDSASGRCLLHQEMTPQEAELRNRQLKAKGAGKRWVLCEEVESVGCCMARTARRETVR
jgi:hypothetical protein